MSESAPVKKFEFMSIVKNSERLVPIDFFANSDLDHTADIQLHSWGDSLAEAFVQVVYAMYGYMTDTDKADIVPGAVCEIEAEGHDLDTLLFMFMDEFLFNFCTEFLVVKTIEMIEFDATNFKIKAIGRGETFDKAKHGQGTEVKAITYSNMQIHQDPATGKCDIYVIVDI